MTQRSILSLAVFAILSIGLALPAAAASCTTSSKVAIADKPEEHAAALQTALAELLGTCTGESGFIISGVDCAKAPAVTLATAAGGTIREGVTATCDASGLQLKFDREKLKAGFAQQQATLTMKQAGASDVAMTTSVPQPRAPAPAAPAATRETPPEKEKPEPALTPSNASNTVRDDLMKDNSCPDGAKCIYLHENLAVDTKSDKYMTDSDRLVVRLIARNAVRCLYRVQSDPGNKSEHEPSRFGGGESMAAIAKAVGVVFTSTKSTNTVKSCGYDINVTKTGDLDVGTSNKLDDKVAASYGVTDFTFGPYSNGTVKILASRYDRNLTKVQLEQVTIQIENRPRYAGWLDVAVFGLHVGGDKLHVDQENGSELRRIRVEDGRSDIDFAVLVKLFVYCSAAGNGLLIAQDVAAARLCLGLSSGFSLTEPANRFFPVGANVTVGSKVSLHFMTVLERGQVLAGGLADGDLFSGSVDDLTTNTELQWGWALGVGLDPSLVGDLIGAIVKGF